MLVARSCHVLRMAVIEVWWVGFVDQAEDVDVLGGEEEGEEVEDFVDEGFEDGEDGSVEFEELLERVECVVESVMAWSWCVLSWLGDEWLLLGKMSVCFFLISIGLVNMIVPGIFKIQSLKLKMFHFEPNNLEYFHSRLQKVVPLINLSHNLRKPFSQYLLIHHFHQGQFFFQ
jgi:hypothetical protein